MKDVMLEKDNIMSCIYRKIQQNIGLFFVVLTIMLSGCKVEVYKGLTEEQVNEMVSILMTRGVDVEKLLAGKAGFSLLVEEEELVLALEILKRHALPREKYTSIGEVFSGQGMVASESEGRSRMAYAISQELSNTFSRIDGVLTARVHVVPGYIDQSTSLKVEPSMGIFLRHTPDSAVINMLPGIREVAAKSLPGLEYDRTSVFLVTAQDPTPIVSKPSVTFFGIPVFPERGYPYFIVCAGILFVAISIGSFLCFGFILLQDAVPLSKKPEEILKLVE